MESTQSQLFHGASHPASKSIPLEKYSSAVSCEESRSHRWVHDARKDLLTLTFKPVEVPIDNGRTETHMFMSVTAGRETLEHLDIQKLVSCSQEHNDRVRRGLVSSSVESPVQVIVRFPCIAMRFPGAPSMVQRFQLKFRNDTQYFQAFNILRRAGLPLKESTVEAKKDAPSQGQNVAHSQPLPSASTQPLPAGHVDVHRKPQFAVPSLESSRRPTQPMYTSSMPPRSDTSSSLSMRPSSTFSADLGGLRSSSSLGISYRDGIASDDFCFQPPPPRPFSSASITRSSPPIYASQKETQQRATLPPRSWTELPSDIVEPRKEEAYVAAPSLPLLSEEAPKTGCDALEKSPRLPDVRQLPRDFTESQTTQQPPDGSNIRRSATATQFAPGLNRSHNNDHLQLGRQSSLSFSTTRPMSAPTVVDDLHVGQWIPPRRELPFPKRKEPKKVLKPSEKAKKGSENGPMLPSEHSKAPERLANTTTVQNHGEQQGKRAAVQRTNTPPNSKLPTVLEVPDSDEARAANTARNSVLWQEEPSPLASKSAAIVRPSTAPGLKSKTINPRKRPAEETPKWALAKRVKMVDASTQTQTLSGRDHTSALSRTSTITAEPVSTAPVTVSVPDPVAPPPESVSKAKGPMEGFMDELDRFIPKHSGTLRPVELWEVSAWDKATDAEREAMTETWICEQIEDPAFLELCRHVDHVWEKIGFKT